jgi:hypothetical protein
VHARIQGVKPITILARSRPCNAPVGVRVTIACHGSRFLVALQFWYPGGVQTLRRFATAAFLVTVAFGVATVNCTRPQFKTMLHDTEGRSFQLTCSEPDRCEVSSSLQPKPSSSAGEGARPGFVLHTASRFFAVCDVWLQGAGSLSINPVDCRALSCSSDADCPPSHGLPHGTCGNQLCIEPGGAIASEDAVLLCLSGTGPPSASNTKQVERLALGSNCGTPCRVPGVCRQP